jgi:hypothetical protein
MKGMSLRNKGKKRGGRKIFVEIMPEILPNFMHW